MVAITLLLVTAVVLNRLDDFFRQQQMADLTARTELVARFVDGVAKLTVGTGPVVQADDTVIPAFAKAMRSDTFSRFMADKLAEADVDVVVGRLVTQNGDSGAMDPATGGTFHVDAESPGEPGLTQEQVTADRHLAGHIEPVPRQYVIAVQLSNPGRRGRPPSATWRR